MILFNAMQKIFIFLKIIPLIFIQFPLELEIAQIVEYIEIYNGLKNVNVSVKCGKISNAKFNSKYTMDGDVP